MHLMISYNVLCALTETVAGLAKPIAELFRSAR
jgi:hypothetical protein